MQTTTFDGIVRELGQGTSRRRALRLLAGGVLGGVLGSVTLGAANAMARPDRDGDGLYDDDETDVYGTNPDVYDTDGDGVGDGEEVYVGTDPLVPEGGAPPPPQDDECPPEGCLDYVPMPDDDLLDDMTGVTCAAGLHNCGAYCANVSQDAANCGVCGWDCGNRDLNFCYLGICVQYCGVGTRRCTGEYHCRPYTEACPA